jgi:hypothetical protein
MNMPRLLLALSSNKEQQPHNRQPVDRVTPYQSNIGVAGAHRARKGKDEIQGFFASLRIT